MKNLFIPYELAVIAKEKGFNEKCFGMYWNRYGHEFILETMLFCEQQMMGEVYQAPLYQQIVDWFRGEHKLIIEIQLDQTSTIKWAYDITKYNDFGDFERKVNVMDWGLYRDYYEALNKAIEEAFKLI